MKLSALLLLGVAACISPAQNVTPSQSTKSIQDQTIILTLDEDASVDPELRALSLRMMERSVQANCPVVLTSAWLAPHLQLLRSGNLSDEKGIDLEFRNASGKAIRSIELSATILVKNSIYDLGYLPPVHLHLTAYGTQNIDSAFAELRRLSLPEEMHPALVDGVRLEQVTFEDGSVWSPATDQFCGLKPDPMRSIAR